MAAGDGEKGGPSGAESRECGGIGVRWGGAHTLGARASPPRLSPNTGRAGGERAEAPTHSEMARGVVWGASVKPTWLPTSPLSLTSPRLPHRNHASLRIFAAYCTHCVPPSTWAPAVASELPPTTATVSKSCAFNYCLSWILSGYLRTKRKFQADSSSAPGHSLLAFPSAGVK